MGAVEPGTVEMEAIWSFDFVETVWKKGEWVGGWGVFFFS